MHARPSSSPAGSFPSMVQLRHQAVMGKINDDVLNGRRKSARPPADTDDEMA